MLAVKPHNEAPSTMVRCVFPYALLNDSAGVVLTGCVVLTTSHSCCGYHTGQCCICRASSSSLPSEEGMCVDIRHHLHVSTVQDSHGCEICLELTSGPVHGVGVPRQPALQITQTHHTITSHNYVTNAFLSLQSPHHTVCHSMLAGQYQASIMGR